MYFIRDCNDKIVGNLKGYKTIAQAIKQQDMYGSKAYKQIWSAYYGKTDWKKHARTISSVK